ncbi:hypothetical protein QAD02_009220 [Eretmocerus hayati]|uniref:Uncharacterized protein n=1 Tax=Eretmocerus hayati TaxID=131215 RepID=A0ACC2NB31_9HYME|nr:hypothetical protein QAD02_009220 [Eretmocerus hayati]
MGLEWSATNEMILERNKGKSVINEESENNEVGVQEQEEGVEEKDEDNPVENERGEDEIEEESDEEDDNFEDAKNSFIPDLIFDEKSGKRYVKGEILGRKGHLAQVFTEFCKELYTGTCRLLLEVPEE